MMNAVIIDDDQMAGMLLSTFIERSGILALKGLFTEPLKALSHISVNKPDLIFLDIEMPTMNGLEFISALGDPRPSIVLVTSHSEFALEAYEYHVADYLVKPVRYSRFLKAVNEVQQRMKNRSNDDHNIFLKKGKTLVRVLKSEIILVEARGDYVIVRTGKDNFIMRSTLKSFEMKLSSAEHIRVHRSFLVRVDNIISIEENSITIGKQTIPIGKSYREAVYRKLSSL